MELYDLGVVLYVLALGVFSFPRLGVMSTEAGILAMERASNVVKFFRDGP